MAWMGASLHIQPKLGQILEQSGRRRRVHGAEPFPAVVKNTFVGVHGELSGRADPQLVFRWGYLYRFWTLSEFGGTVQREGSNGRTVWFPPIFLSSRILVIFQSP